MNAPYVPLRPGDVWVPRDKRMKGRRVVAVPSERVEFGICGSIRRGSCSWTAWREWVERTGATCRTEAET